ncbi:(2Fe-2S)-binding protein [Williamsia sp.]|uniref:(2Fe-2S)-binding protein n=1 Tax=Williamsia sp. TaxID=1872085 RepID=UPI002F94A7BE
MHDTSASGETSPDVAMMFARMSASGMYFTLGTGPVAGGDWQPTATLRQPAIRDRVVAEVARQLGVDEVRVAASTLFFGFAARLWSVAAGTRQADGRCVSIAPEELLWRSVNGSLHLHLEVPRMGRSPGVEVLDDQLEPCIEAWKDIVAPGLLWGNTTSALLGAAGVTKDTTAGWVVALLGDPRLQQTLDPNTGLRRSCCLYYRTPGGGVCGDCPFPSAPSAGPVTQES